ncbi:MAG: winged helix-turn-helix transcriptional regulator [Treponema succinifaciens]|uniref:winged helix-turn-helix transcriptional regulator n=2 Tax=Treponemataceae TaxID=2845253 RepID=UPI0023F00CE3|nr:MULTISPECIES: winged helix-turn-helix transcriptional regulator [Treponema]MDD6963056.1 winged helix-turn-helix transcriptional regulator [Treponema succinifaciens]MDY5117848.1 winged helix-turn-helix transcriptional regulator [Treponema succinifaciens]
MPKKKSPYELDFEEYIRNSEPAKKEKTYAWTTAIGLQQVDGLTPSKYLFETAKRNIDGEISVAEATSIIDSYYESKTDRSGNDNERTEEADKVSSRIAQILSEKSFNFSPSYLIALHGRLFAGIFKFAGKIRDYDISKKEWVLDGDSVMYGAAFELKAALDYDFEQERHFSYKNLTLEETVKHITFFVSRLWQIHAFGEGNTRTTAVFTIKYLRSLGFNADNELFAENSWYFRNALVRANYNNLQKGIHENQEFLEKFFRNLLLGEHNELKNRFLHIRAKDFLEIKENDKNVTANYGKVTANNENDTRNVKKVSVNDKNVTRNVTVNSENISVNNKNITVKLTQTQKDILNLIKENPCITQNEIASKLNIARETVNRNMKKLQQEKIIQRLGADKNGSWKILR